MYKTTPPKTVKKVPPWVKYLASFMILYFVISLVATLHGFWKLKQEEKHLHQVIADLQEENRRLTKQVSIANTDYYVEKLAREKLGLVKPAETLIITTDKGDKPGMWKINSSHENTKNVTD